MKQLQFTYDNEQQFTADMLELKKQLQSNNNCLFRIFSSELRKDIFPDISKILDNIFPDAVYVGCTTCGNIVNCELSAEVSVVCTVFEDASTRADIRCYNLVNDSIENITQSITEEAGSTENLKAMEMYFAITDISNNAFCEGLDNIDKSVQIFGGIACGPDISASDSFVFAKGYPVSSELLTVIFYKGENLYIESLKTTGWKPFGASCKITRADGQTLYELNGMPAFKAYNKYLHIENDEYFFENALEFPIFYEHNNEKILKVPLASNPDNSLTMSSEVEQGKTITIAYGDPQSIIDSIDNDIESFRQFAPDVIHIFSCCARLTFWGEDDAAYELEPLKEISPVSGFFSHGEFIRTHDHLNMHNVTLVLAAMREGPVRKNRIKSIPASEKRHKKVPLIARLGTFLQETTSLINDINENLKQEREHYHQVLTSGCEYNCSADLTEGIIKDINLHDSNTDLYNHLGLKTPMPFNELIRKFLDFHELILLDDFNHRLENEMTTDELMIKCRSRLTREGLLESFDKGIKKTETQFYNEQLKAYFSLIVLMSRNKSNGHVLALVLGQDVTEKMTKHVEHTRILNEAIKAARQASEAKTNFLANMSHEIRTPMNAVLGMSEMALREEMSDTARDYIHQIRNSGKNLLVIINDILDFSKIESGKLDIVKVSYEPLSIIHNISNIVNTRISGNNIEFTMDIDPHLPKRLYGDSVRIQQILINLLNNAVKFTKQGQVHLSIKCDFKDDKNVVLYMDVSDTGIGIKPENLNKLFRSFEQIDNKRNRNIEGTGLGLSISQSLLKLMGGSISVNSTYNVGSTFSCILPQTIKEANIETMCRLTDNCIIYAENRYLKEQLKTDLDKAEVSFSYAENEDDVLSSDAKIFIIDRCYLTDSIISMVKCNPDIKCLVLAPFDSTEKSDIQNIKIIRKPVYSFVLYSALGIIPEMLRESDCEDTLLSFTAPEANILIVDDTPINLTVANGLLAPLEMNIDNALSAKECFKMLESKKYDIIFMDHMMPEIDGVEATHIIRTQYPDHANTPIIALTANAIGGAMEMFLHEGMNDFVAKPIDIKIITSKLRKWLPSEKIIISDKQVNVSAEESGIQIAGLDTESAIKLLGTKELFMEILETYYNSIDSRYAVIKKLFDEKDIKGYTIEVHSLKSSSRQIGAEKLAGLAASLEQAGNENNIALIEEKTMPMLDMFIKYKEILKPYFADDEKQELKPMTPEILMDILTNIETALGSFDILEIEDAVDKLGDYSANEKLKKDFENLKKCAEEYDMEKCAEIIRKIKKDC